MPGLLCSQPNSWIITTNLLLHRALLCLTLMENYSSGSVAAAACGRLGPARTYSGQLLSGGEERSTRVENHKRKQDRIFAVLTTSCFHSRKLCDLVIKRSDFLLLLGFVLEVLLICPLALGMLSSLYLTDNITKYWRVLSFFLQYMFSHLPCKSRFPISRGSQPSFLTFQRTTFPNRWQKLQDLTTFNTLFHLKKHFVLLRLREIS